MYITLLIQLDMVILTVVKTDFGNPKNQISFNVTGFQAATVDVAIS
jgi:hypothetical protein